MLSITQTGWLRSWCVPLMILCWSLLSGCTNVTMMSQYDEKTEQRIDQFSKNANQLLVRLEDIDAEKPECSYENHASAYQDLKVQLRIMHMHEQAKANNTKTQKQVESLQKRLQLLIKDHKRICQPAGAVHIAQQQINMMLGNILKLEHNKNGAKPNNLFFVGKKP